MKGNEIYDDRDQIKPITINIPNIYDEHIKELIKLDKFQSRSDAFRKAVKDFLLKECDNLKLLGL